MKGKLNGGAIVLGLLMLYYILVSGAWWKLLLIYLIFRFLLWFLKAKLGNNEAKNKTKNKKEGTLPPKLKSKLSQR
jgi:hypothetical protein